MEPDRVSDGWGSAPVEGGPAAAGSGPDDRRGGGSGPLAGRVEIIGRLPDPTRGTGGSGPVLARPRGEVAAGGGAGGCTVAVSRVTPGRDGGTGAADGDAFAPGFFFRRRENFS
jgi:hypothetical protein